MKTVLASLLGAIIFSVTGAAAGEFWARHTIDPADPESGKRGADGVRLGDLNQDGLPDLVTGWEEGGITRVCLNPGPEKASSPWPAITVGPSRNVEDAVFADLDGNGILDVVTSTEGGSKTVFAHWAPDGLAHLTDETAWTTEAFPATTKTQSWMFCLPRDVDQDGDIDLILGSKGESASVSWLENPGHDEARDLSAWPLHHLADASWIMTLSILEGVDSNALLYSNRKGETSGVYQIPLLDEAPWFGNARLIGASGEEVMFLDQAHLNDDERIDVVASIKPNQTWIFYQPPTLAGPWTETTELDPFSQEQFGTAKAVKVADLTKDQIPDFVITCEKADGKKSGVLMSNVFSKYHDISGREGVKFDRIELLDLDADGDLDMITCEERHNLGVIWYENPTL